MLLLLVAAPEPPFAWLVVGCQQLIWARHQEADPTAAAGVVVITLNGRRRIQSFFASALNKNQFRKRKGNKRRHSCV